MRVPKFLRRPSSLTHPLSWPVIVTAALVLGSSYIAMKDVRSERTGAAEANEGSGAPAGQSPFAARNPRLNALPPADEDQITFAQFTDNRPLDLSRSGGRVGFVWGGSGRSGLSIGSRYYPLDRDMNRSHTGEWYAQNFPDRIVYECDQRTPAALFTYSWGYYAPVDTTNPAVRQYLFDTYIGPALASGQKIIAIDNVNLRNTGKRCGVFRGGRWVQLYSGQGPDPAYAAAVLDWVAWLASQVHARGGLLALNAKVDPDNVEGTRKLIQLGDIWLDEAAFTRNCNARASDRNWQVKMDLSQWAAARMPWVSLEKTCASPASLSPEEAQWVVGNFLLAKGPQSYLGAFHDGDQRLALQYPPTLNPPVGRPVGAAFTIPGGMARRFSHGLVLVNPSSRAPLSYSLPAGRWTTAAGVPASGSISLQPTTAAVLISR